jgi:Zn-dependent M28 family amino/carboxypeptidase
VARRDFVVIGVKRLAILAIVLIAAVVGGFMYLTNMPGRPRPAALLTTEEQQTVERLRKHVEVLASDVRGRASYVEAQLRAFGYEPELHRYDSYVNIAAELRGSDEIVIIGAHHDTAGGLPGANDNGSGVAATLELARAYAGNPFKKTVRWLFFANEEPPYFQTELMGSWVYARRCRERNERISAMLSLETIGYYSSEPGSQKYPVGFHPGYPDRGDYLGFVSDVKSAPLLRRVVKAFREGTSLPSQGAAAPNAIAGVGWSDHWSFWQFGYRAVMVTDTAPYRYPYYHTRQDTAEKLDYQSMARAITGLKTVVRRLAD